MPTTLQTLGDWLQYLEQLHPTAIEMGLDRVRSVAQRLIDFTTLAPAVIVTGTNGKGSTVMTMEAVALAHGRKPGTYMSPHLLRYNERIRIGGKMASDDDIVASFRAVEAARGDVSLTYFEFGTLGALWFFAREQADVLFLEVGLGGRLDAVNIVEPAVSVVTSIALDHQGWLGNTREQVCFEKAGIRRPCKPLICGDRHPPANLAKLCEETHTPLLMLGRDFDDDHSGSDPSIRRWTVPDNDLLPDNMACGLEALAQLQAFPLDSQRIAAALQSLQVPGRRQRLQQHPAVYVDVGHNPHAARALAAWLDDIRGEGRILAVVGMLSDKDYNGTLACLNASVDAWYPVGLGGPRGLSAQHLEEQLRSSGAKCRGVFASPLDGLQAALTEAAENDTIIAFGSFYTVADVLSHYSDGTHGI